MHDPLKLPDKLEDEGLSYDFSREFQFEKVIDTDYSQHLTHS